MPRFDTLHALLAANARDDRQITFVDGESEQRVMSFRQLQRRALGVLGALRGQGIAAGDHMVICLADNERLVEIFWACVLGGIVPVPLSPSVNDEARRKLFGVFGRLERAFVYIDAPSLDRLDAFAAAEGLDDVWSRLRSSTVIAGSLAVDGGAGQLREPAPDDVAFIQFSSGSTGEPKGVVLSHRNLGSNIAGIHAAAQFTDRDIAFSWMPLSHDMGLIGFHLSMLGASVSHTIMRTELFARRPLMWLDQASKRRATLLCSPNFGYQHYLRQYELKRPANLDLSAVRLIFNGAEPVSAELCRRFSLVMAPHGLDAAAMFPVYGLAEASLAVTFPQPGAQLQTVVVDRSARDERSGEARDVGSDAARPAEFVMLGTPIPGSEVRIVDEASQPRPDRQVGRILTRGDNVTRRFIGADPASSVLDADGWLDTGDLGMLWNGQLVVTGRAKDLVIVNGQNFYPHDIERIAEQVPGIEPGRVAVAGVGAVTHAARSAAVRTDRVADDPSTDTLAVFVVHRADVESFVDKAMQVRRAIRQQTGIDDVRVIPVTSIPKTTSGKLQRHLLSGSLQRGDFAEVLARLDALAPERTDAAAVGDTPASVLSRLLPICRRLVPDTPIGPATNLLEIDLNSLTLARIHEAIEREFPGRLDVTELFDYPTLSQLAQFLESSGT